MPLPEQLRPVLKSTSASGAPDNSSLSHFSAMTRPSWLGRAVRNRHRHAIEQAPRRRRGERRDDSARTRRKILISTQVARLQGLKDLYDELGFTSEKHKASLDYLLTLMASSSNKEYVAFDSMGKVTSI